MKHILFALCLMSLLNVPLKSEAIEQYNELCCDECPYRGVAISCLEDTFDIDFRALWLQPYASNLHYVAEAEPLPLPSPNWFINDIRPDYNFAFDLGASVAIPSRSTTISANWVHFDSSDSASKQVPSENMVGPFFAIGPDTALYTEAKGKNKFHFDAVNVDYGIAVDFGCHFHTIFFGGIAGARIKQDLSSFYSSEDHVFTRKIKTPSSFLGAGPRAGLDFSFDICKGLQFKGGGAGALLVGRLKNHTTYESVSPFLIPLEITPPNKQSTTVNNRTQLVPSLEGRLGLGYDFKLCDYTVNVEAGYEARIYFNVLQSIDMGSEVVTPPVVPDVVGVFARTFQRNSSNFALAGPYVRLNVDF